MNANTSVLEAWMDLKKLVESLEYDAVKGANGNMAAHTRLRKGLRTIKRDAQALTKVSLQLTKDYLDNKKDE